MLKCNDNENNIIYLSYKYNFPLKDEYKKNKKLRYDTLSQFITFNPNNHMQLDSLYNKDPNDIIKINKEKIDLRKLENIQEYLNTYKLGIDAMDEKKWNKIIFETNITNDIMKTAKKEYGFEITRGFTKLYEILYTYQNLIFGKSLNMLKKEENIDTLHICEAPGHYINATHYFINKTFPNKKHAWYANSLNPKNEKNNKDDYFEDIYGFIKNYEKYWIWGKDNTGDITTEENVRYFKENFENKFIFFTSDCGLKTQNRSEYYTQESWMSILNYSQILISLITLKLGGSAVFKLFAPITKPISVSLINLLCVFYETVYFNKPLTSSATNNEIYIIAINKKYNLSNDNFEKMVKLLNNFDKDINLFDLKNIDKLLIDGICIISEFFSDKIIKNLSVIYKIYDYPKDLKEINNQIIEAKKRFSNNWYKYFNLKIEQGDEKLLLRST